MLFGSVLSARDPACTRKKYHEIMEHDCEVQMNSCTLPTKKSKSIDFSNMPGYIWLALPTIFTNPWASGTSCGKNSSTIDISRLITVVRVSQMDFMSLIDISLFSLIWSSQMKRWTMNMAYSMCWSLVIWPVVATVMCAAAWAPCLLLMLSELNWLIYLVLGIRKRSDVRKEILFTRPVRKTGFSHRTCEKHVLYPKSGTTKTRVFPPQMGKTIFTEEIFTKIFFNCSQLL